MSAEINGDQMYADVRGRNAWIRVGTAPADARPQQLDGRTETIVGVIAAGSDVIPSQPDGDKVCVTSY